MSSLVTEIPVNDHFMLIKRKQKYDKCLLQIFLIQIFSLSLTTNLWLCLFLYLTRVPPPARSLVVPLAAPMQHSPSSPQMKFFGKSFYITL